MLIRIVPEGTFELEPKLLEMKNPWIQQLGNVLGLRHWRLLLPFFSFSRVSLSSVVRRKWQKLATFRFMYAEIEERRL